MSLTRPDSALPHRTRGNVAQIDGLASAISIHIIHIRAALQNGNESKLQRTLADLMADASALESAIVEQEQ